MTHISAFLVASLCLAFSAPLALADATCVANACVNAGESTTGEGSCDAGAPSYADSFDVVAAYVGGPYVTVFATSACGAIDDGASTERDSYLGAGAYVYDPATNTYDLVAVYWFASSTNASDFCVIGAFESTLGATSAPCPFGPPSLAPLVP